MVNHPNRGKKSAAATPAPEEILAGRVAADLTQTEAAELIYSSLRTWQQWEAGDRRMHPGLWELFRIKANLITLDQTPHTSRQ
ncbi:XRE family transcriptional regulator [bacterium]|nr:MAG: XRE family transcriptional regulator [bacterium]